MKNLLIVIMITLLSTTVNAQFGNQASRTVQGIAISHYQNKSKLPEVIEAKRKYDSADVVTEDCKRLEKQLKKTYGKESLEVKEAKLLRKEAENREKYMRASYINLKY